MSRGKCTHVIFFFFKQKSILFMWNEIKIVCEVSDSKGHRRLLSLNFRGIRLRSLWNPPYIPRQRNIWYRNNMIPRGLRGDLNWASLWRESRFIRPQYTTKLFMQLFAATVAGYQSEMQILSTLLSYNTLLIFVLIRKNRYILLMITVFATHQRLLHIKLDTKQSNVIIILFNIVH